MLDREESVRSVAVVNPLCSTAEVHHSLSMVTNSRQLFFPADAAAERGQGRTSPSRQGPKQWEKGIGMGRLTSQGVESWFVIKLY